MFAALDKGGDQHAGVAAPGASTAIVRGYNNSAGIALVEVYGLS
jgi:hypothetical protein